uniref:Protein N-terminal glutamine amidohydrolase n=1 Tax=Schistocephalus solidus TaxID=70667 RepID=A0A0X3PWD3_SCHSO
MEINRDICVYTPQYCEENVYKLLENIEIASESDFYAVFISNPKKQVPLFCQRKGDENEDNLVLWESALLGLSRYCHKVATDVKSCLRSRYYLGLSYLLQELLE